MPRRVALLAQHDAVAARAVHAAAALARGGVIEVRGLSLLQPALRVQLRGELAAPPAQRLGGRHTAGGGSGGGGGGSGSGGSGGGGGGVVANGHDVDVGRRVCGPLGSSGGGGGLLLLPQAVVQPPEDRLQRATLVRAQLLLRRADLAL